MYKCRAAQIARHQNRAEHGRLRNEIQAAQASSTIPIFWTVACEIRIFSNPPATGDRLKTSSCRSSRAGPQSETSAPGQSRSSSQLDSEQVGSEKSFEVPSDQKRQFSRSARAADDTRTRPSRSSSVPAGSPAPTCSIPETPSAAPGAAVFPASSSLMRSRSRAASSYDSFSIAAFRSLRSRTARSARDSPVMFSAGICRHAGCHCARSPGAARVRRETPHSRARSPDAPDCETA